MVELAAKSLLAEAFERSDTVSWNGLKVVKEPGKSWNTAKFYKNDEEIALTGRQKQILALMIARKGAPVLAEDIMQEIKLRPSKLSNPNADPTAKVINNVKVHLSALRKTLSDSWEIASLNPYRAKGEMGQWTPEFKGSFQLLQL